MHVIRYCIDLSNCPDYNPLPGVPCEYCTDQVTYVFPEFNAQFAVPQTICENDTPLDLILTDEAGVLALFDTYEGDFDPTGEIREEEVYVNWFGDGVMELPLASATNATGGARGTPRALFDPAVAGPGLHIITVEVGYGDCQHTYTQAITVTTGNPAIQDVTVCESPSGTINLVAMLDNTPLGGLWTFSNPDGIINFSETNGILTYQIDPGALPATPGVYTLDVTYTLCGVVSAPARITVTGATETGFDLLSTWCEDAGDITLADFTAQGGGTWYLVSENGTDIVPPTNINATFGGTILVGGLAYVAGQSTLEILYQPAAGGCGVPITQFITVYEAVDATVVPVSDICDTDPPLDLSALEAGTQGGVWTSEGPDGNAIQLGTTLFDTDIEGNYHLTYTVTNGTCTESSTFYLKVHRLLDPSIGNVDICESPSGTVNLNALKFPTTTPGGTWSIVGGTGTFAGLSPSGDQLTYLIDPTATPPYTIEVQYTLTGDAGAPAACDFELSVATITITGATETGFDLPSTWCEDAGDINLADFTASGGGVWYLMSENGVNIVPPTNINATFGGNIIVGGLAYVGGQSILEIRHQPSAGGCGIPRTEFITVSEGVDATLTGTPDGLCIFTDTPLDLSTLYGPTTTVGGTWTIIGPDGVNPFPLGSTNFEPAIAGWYSLIYTVTNGVCTATDNFQVFVHSALNANINDVTICESPSGTVNLSAMMDPNTVAGSMLDGTTLGGVWAYEALGSNIPAANVSINNDVLTYTIPAGIAAPYTIAVSYTLTGALGAPAP